MEAAASLITLSCCTPHSPRHEKVDFHCGKKDKLESQRNALDITHLKSQSHHLVVSGAPALSRLSAQALQSLVCVPCLLEALPDLSEPLLRAPQGLMF